MVAYREYRPDFSSLERRLQRDLFLPPFFDQDRFRHKARALSSAWLWVVASAVLLCVSRQHRAQYRLAGIHEWSIVEGINKGKDAMTRQERQAQTAHPKLYALNQHRLVRALAPVADFLEAAVSHATTVKTRGGRKARPPRQPRVQRSTYYGSRTPRTVVAHVYSGATVNLHNV